jgi:hypothetical protein
MGAILQAGGILDRKRFPYLIDRGANISPASGFIEKPAACRRFHCKSMEKQQCSAVLFY